MKREGSKKKVKEEENEGRRKHLNKD